MRIHHFFAKKNKPTKEIIQSRHIIIIQLFRQPIKPAIIVAQPSVPRSIIVECTHIIELNI